MGDPPASTAMTWAYVAGIAPRSTTYMRAHWDHAKALLDDAGLEVARAAERELWVTTQREAGLDLLSPAYVETEDILRPLTELAGAEAGPLTRTFETNTFHRRPVISAPVPEQGLRPWVDQVALDADWVLSLPSPYDAVVRSDVAKGVGNSIAVCLRDAAAYALSRGAVRVRFQEPSAVYRGHHGDAPRLAGLLAAATRGIEDACIVHFTQGDVLAHPEILAAVPCVGIGIDVHETSMPSSAAIEGKELHAGVVRGESSLVETVEATQHAVAIAEAGGATLVAVTNGWDLEHVPFDVAVAKLAALVSNRPVEVAA